MHPHRLIAQVLRLFRQDRRTESGEARGGQLAVPVQPEEIDPGAFGSRRVGLTPGDRHRRKSRQPHIKSIVPCGHIGIFHLSRFFSHGKHMADTEFMRVLPGSFRIIKPDLHPAFREVIRCRDLPGSTAVKTDLQHNVDEYRLLNFCRLSVNFQFQQKALLDFGNT